MPVLLNERHELFAQEIAKGTEAGEAYAKAGFKPNAGNGRRLKMDEAVSKRVEALLMEREALYAQSTALAIERAGLTKEWIIERLRENAERALQAIPVMADGEPTGEYRYEGNVANRALELLGKEIGMFIEKTENKTVVRTISDQPLTPAEWEAERATTH